MKKQKDSRAIKVLLWSLKHWRKIAKDCIDGVYEGDSHYGDPCPACKEWYDSHNTPACADCLLKGWKGHENSCCDGNWVAFASNTNAIGAVRMVDYILMIIARVRSEEAAKEKSNEAL